MFKVYKLNDEGNEDLIAFTPSRSTADELFDMYSEQYPHALIDYYYTEEL